MVVQVRSNEGFCEDHASGGGKKGRDEEGCGSGMNVNWQVV